MVELQLEGLPSVLRSQPTKYQNLFAPSGSSIPIRSKSSLPLPLMSAIAAPPPAFSLPISGECTVELQLVGLPSVSMSQPIKYQNLFAPSRSSMPIRSKSSLPLPLTSAMATPPPAFSLPIAGDSLTELQLVGLPSVSMSQPTKYQNLFAPSGSSMPIRSKSGLPLPLMSAMATPPPAFSLPIAGDSLTELQLVGLLLGSGITIP